MRCSRGPQFCDVGRVKYWYLPCSTSGISMKSMRGFAAERGKDGAGEVEPSVRLAGTEVKQAAGFHSGRKIERHGSGVLYVEEVPLLPAVWEVGP